MKLRFLIVPVLAVLTLAGSAQPSDAALIYMEKSPLAVLFDGDEGDTNGTCTCTGHNGVPYTIPAATKGDCDGLIRAGRNCTWTPAPTSPPGTSPASL